jgi:hypothetical protein
MSLKLVKLKNVRNKKEIIKWLITLLKETETIYSPLIEEINHPTEEFFIIKDEDNFIPAYILCDKDEALVLWVHESFRNRGYANFMIKTMNVKYAVASPTSILFWQRVGFERVSNSMCSGPIRVKKKNIR